MKYTSKKKNNAALKIILSVLLIILAVMLICISCLYIFKNKNSSDNTVSISSLNEENLSSEPSLSDLFILCEGSDNLYEFTGNAFDEMYYPEIYLTDCGLVIYDTNYSESEESCVNFYIFDPESGEITAENKFACEFLTDIRQTEKGLMFCDSSLGYVILLDESLNTLVKWTFEANYEYWYISTDGTYLYMISDNSLNCINLETLNAETVLSGLVSMYGGQSINDGAYIGYIDESQMSVIAWLDLESGQVSYPVFEESINTASKNDDIWLCSLTGLNNTYICGTDDDSYVISLESGTLNQVNGADYLLYLSDDGTELFLYDAGGEFISSCNFSGDDIWISSTNYFYSEIYGGFFIPVYTDTASELYFWDINASAQGEALELLSLDEYEKTPGGTASESFLYERADELSEEYGVEILIADQCETVYDDFTAEPVYDTEIIENGLDILENALSKYPDGFIEQLKYDDIKGIQINLMGTLTPTNDNWGEEDYNGLTQESCGLNVMVLDLNELYEQTIYHEFSHIIDKKLEWDSYCRSGALFSEEGWEALNPEGFEYIYEYSGFTELEFEDEEYLYFIDTYSMVSPTEDRARIMEYAMGGYDSYFTDYEPTMAKLSYYAKCIRDCFDTTGWEEVCAWEEVLN